MSGDVTGAFGLTIEPTPHEVRIGEVRRYTWCAIDAVGILSALGATGSITSHSPHTGRPIELGFRDREPTSGDLDSGVFVAGYEPGSKVVESWCPLVNFFEDAAGAEAWAAEHRVSGDFVPVAHAASSAGERWRARLEVPVEPAR
jgi:hypothetical protein